MTAKDWAIGALIAVILAALWTRRKTSVDTSIRYGPPTWRGRPGDVVTYGDRTWAWTEAPEVGLPGEWIEIADSRVYGYI